ncbi:uncharacterized protein pre-mod(mdg4)-AD [Drosophila pseudoobscura]|uniref:Uncharacterized protein pre-mod(Mdg4)-AD n=1 Tax=Drosophila pseudoobscura pseudoobscura TaxID=46245 RepID=A0A6I8VD99_DROPS|nr:uncharacterized protein LOC26532286 [Drosophila pseudoobscura]
MPRTPCRWRWRWRLPAGDQSARWPKPHIQWSHVLSGAKVPCQHQLEGQGQVLAEYVRSRRGTGLVYYEGNTYTPNEKLREGQKSRDWKCSMYHKAKCRARLVTRHTRIGDLIHVTSRLHTHPRMYDHLYKSEDKDSRKLFPKLSPHKKESK